MDHQDPFFVADLPHLRMTGTQLVFCYDLLGSLAAQADAVAERTRSGEAPPGHALITFVRQRYGYDARMMQEHAPKAHRLLQEHQELHRFLAMHESQIATCSFALSWTVIAQFRCALRTADLSPETYTALDTGFVRLVTAIAGNELTARITQDPATYTHGTTPPTTP
ncbi:hypothetical protein HY632_03115 [Candidatus Uhrbacteria bacterium]|nr:hypothetical protein [Candidatus Uhrbacteria bacterium]